MDTMFHKRHPDFEPYDKVTIEAVPRYKTSGLSGDEWRMSALVQFWFKGVVVHEQSFGSMKWAMMLLASAWEKGCTPYPDEVLRREEGTCDQPSCAEKWTTKYLIKQEFSQRGERLDPTDRTFQSFRKFCSKHARRGDCGREDSDANYEVLEGAGPNGSTNTEESPSVLGGVINGVDGLVEGIEKIRREHSS